ncbi:MAG: AMMECR1 domain-containing protein [Candidatus Nanoclepta minutus]|uniref:Protein BXU00_00700 n=1 Tax=Candidatus Nanoclepta minutus TaxID=1940235 RepID=A0A397WQ36_9ARCH|nr:MAG: AMMECR1 domain-containing protein [Candidatus Nanoclepta minutus]
MYSLKEGEMFVKTSRKVIKHYLETKEIIFPEEIKKYEEKRGVFTTIKNFRTKDLRGCIGFPFPIYPLWKALVLSSISAATEDPRFEPMKIEELNECAIEINILSEPEIIKVENPEDYPKHIEIGKHGIIVQYGIYSGLLLPEVAVENNWDEYTFLSYTCLKAGLPPDSWIKLPIKIYRFTSQIFQEIEPEGEVIEIKLK